MRPVHPLDRHPEGKLAAIFLDADIFEIGEQIWARIPGRFLALFRDIVAEARRDRNCEAGRKSERRREIRERACDPRESRRIVTDKIDLVHREHDVADAEQRDDRRMPMRLGKQSLAAIDEKDGEIAVGGAGRHIARILFVARRIGDDEGALAGRESAIGDIDRDALLAFCFESVDQQREIDVGADGAVFLRIALERGELIVENELLLIKQPADESRFAVVDRTAGEKAQGRQRVLVGRRSRRALFAEPRSRLLHSSEIALALLLFHRARFIVVDQPALPLRRSRRCAFRR